jgi:hypothetical protein
MNLRTFKAVGVVLITSILHSCADASPAPQENTVEAKCMLAIPTPYRIPFSSTPEVVSDKIENRKKFREAFDKFTDGEFPVVGVGFYTLTYSSESCDEAQRKLEEMFKAYPFIDASALFSSDVIRDEDNKIIVPQELQNLVNNASPSFLNNEGSENQP